jgi:hypothetical protein
LDLIEGLEISSDKVIAGLSLGGRKRAVAEGVVVSNDRTQPATSTKRDGGLAATGIKNDDTAMLMVPPERAEGQ